MRQEKEEKSDLLKISIFGTIVIEQCVIILFFFSHFNFFL